MTLNYINSGLTKIKNNQYTWKINNDHSLNIEENNNHSPRDIVILPKCFTMFNPKIKNGYFPIESKTLTLLTITEQWITSGIILNKKINKYIFVNFNTSSEKSLHIKNHFLYAYTWDLKKNKIMYSNSEKLKKYEILALNSLLQMANKNKDDKDIIIKWKIIDFDDIVNISVKTPLLSRTEIMAIK